MNETKQAKFTRGDWATYSSNIGRSMYDGIGIYRDYPMESIALAEFASSLTKEEVEANAYLIAAAPALYEALSELRSYLRDNPHMRIQCDDLATELGFAAATSAADQALAKANGPAVGHTDAF